MSFFICYIFISLERVFKVMFFYVGCERYVCGEKEEIVLDGKGKRLDGEDRIFAREAEGFF